MNFLTKDKEIAKETFRIAVPTVIESLFICLTGMVDTWMIAAYDNSGVCNSSIKFVQECFSLKGSECITAIGLSTQPKIFLFSIFFSLNIAISSRISFKRGQKNQEHAANMFMAGLWFTLIASIVISVLSCIFAQPIVALCGGKATTLVPSTRYFQIVMGTMIFTMFSLFFNAVLRGCGKPKISMISNVVSNTVNVVFNYLLINGHYGFPKWGIVGAAVATAFGQVIACGMSTACMFNKNNFVNFQYIIKNKIRCAKEQTKDLFGMAKTLLLESLLMRAGFMLSHILNGRLPAEPYAANVIGMHFMNLGFAFGDGLQNATMILVGKCFGEKNLEKAMKYFNFARMRGLMIAVAVSACLVIFGRPIYGIFFPDPAEEAIIGYGIVIFRFIAVIMPVQIVRIVISGFLRGAGDVKYSMYASTISNTFVQPAVLVVLILMLNLGYIGTWSGILAAQVTTFLLFEWRILSGKWKESKYLKEANN